MTALPTTLSPKLKNTLILVYKASLNPILLGSVALLFVIIFFGIIDTFIKPNLVKMGELDAAIQQQKTVNAGKQQEQRQFTAWKSQLKDLSTIIPELKEGQSPKVAAVSESKHVMDLAQKEAVDIKGEPLPPPHNMLEYQGFDTIGDTTYNILQNEPDAQSQKPINLAKFNYSIMLRGTYPALTNFINQLVASHSLIEITKLEILPGESAGPGASAGLAGRRNGIVQLGKIPSSLTPGASGEDNPHIPVNLVLGFTIYIYDPNQQ